MNSLIIFQAFRIFSQEHQEDDYIDISVDVEAEVLRIVMTKKKKTLNL